MLLVLLPAGPSPCWVLGIIQLMGKTLCDDFVCKGVIRHKDPLLCAQGALARHFVMRYIAGMFIWLVYLQHH